LRLRLLFILGSRVAAMLAVIAKMPIVMQDSMQALQGRLGALMPRLRQPQRKAIDDLKSGQSKLLQRRAPHAADWGLMTVGTLEKVDAT
jgi:hypothetical protein